VAPQVDPSARHRVMKVNPHDMALMWKCRVLLEDISRWPLRRLIRCLHVQLRGPGHCQFRNEAASSHDVVH
jgi:hypothetical protein